MQSKSIFCLSSKGVSAEDLQLELMSTRTAGISMSSLDQPAADALAINSVLIAVRQAADVLCDRWTLSLLLLAFAGVSRFGEFGARTGMASRQLTQRLKTLEMQEIMVRMPYSRRPLRYGTHLTTMGEALFDVFACMVAWQQGFGVPNDECIAGIRHPGCVDAFALPELGCENCENPVTARNVGGPKVQQREIERLPMKKTTYRRTTRSGSASADSGPLADCIAILGDKWTIEILVIVFMRVESFVEIQRHSGISSNVLTDRFAHLLANGVLRQTAESEPGRTGSYRLTDKGIAFYPILLAIQAWADTWLPSRLRSPLELEHRPCARPLELAMRCAACRRPLAAAQCQFQIG